MAIDTTAALQVSYSKVALKPDLIKSIKERKPHILWVGCSDSWITETETLNVLPEEMFIHRNLGSVISNDDLSSKTALQYCVDVLAVQHIVICGHYDCGLIKSDNGPEADHGWHRDLSLLRIANEAYLKNAELSQTERNRHLEEIWVLAELQWLKKQPSVSNAIETRGLQLYAFVFDKESGACLQLLETV